MCASRRAWVNSERGRGAEVRSNALTRAQCRETTQGKAHGTQAILGTAMMGTLEGRAGVSQHAISVIIPAQQRLIAQDPPSRHPTAQPPNRPTAQSLSRSVAQQHRCRPASAPQVRAESPLRTATALEAKPPLAHESRSRYPNGQPKLRRLLRVLLRLWCLRNTIVQVIVDAGLSPVWTGRSSPVC